LEVLCIYSCIFLNFSSKPVSCIFHEE
jgi:hypothetical protein